MESAENTPMDRYADMEGPNAYGLCFNEHEIIDEEKK
jgi:hypothetical protein